MSKIKSVLRIILSVAVVVLTSVALFACGEETDNSVAPSPDKPGTAGLSYALAIDENGENYAFVKSYDGSSAKIEVAEIAGDAPVKAFSGDVFRNKDFIEEIVFPSGVASIPSNAFENCSSLKSVTAAGVSEVGADAFKGTAFMESLPNGAVYFNSVLCDYKIAEDRINTISTLKINDGTTAVTTAVLKRLTSLSEVNISNDFPVVLGMFDNMGALQRITVRTEGSGTLTSVDGVLYDGSILLKYPEGKTNVSFTVPATVKIIASRAMSKAPFSTLSFAGIVEYVGEEAFLNCSNFSAMSYGTSGGYVTVGRAAFKGTNFTAVTFPSALENLGDDNFAYSSVRTIRFAADGNLKVIGDRAFKGCAALTGTDAKGNLILPDTVEQIGNSAFYNCKNILSVDVGEGLVSLGGAAFYGLLNLTSVALSPVLEEIGGNAFYGCVGLSEIVFPYSLKEIGNSAFKGCSSLSAVYFGSAAEQNYEKSKLEYIGSSAFENCSALTQFTAPYCLEKIASAAFRNSGLISMTVLRNKSLGITKLGLYNLDGTRVNEIIVPINSVQEYKAATGWSFASDSIFAAEQESGAATVFFDTDGRGLVIEKTAVAGTIVVNRAEINVEIPIEVATEITESVNADGKKVIITKTTVSGTYIEGWYLTADFADGSEVVFDGDGNYRPEVSANSYTTMYAKWKTDVSETVTEEVVDA